MSEGSSFIISTYPVARKGTKDKYKVHVVVKEIVDFVDFLFKKNVSLRFPTCTGYVYTQVKLQVVQVQVVLCVHVVPSLQYLKV
jgi:hypothetical protein